MAADLIWTAAPTPLGTLTIVASADGIRATDLGDGGRLVKELGAHRDDHALAADRDDVEAYFARELKAFRSPVDLSFAHGFARDVYVATIDVPYGELRTYGDVAAAAGSPRAFRAAGTALRHCPIELWIPCHRVVPAGPGFGTYGGHPEHREFLLRSEGAI
jgi:methylated-DNA-[protein]-cysteine S-methyltransferase